MTLKRSPSSNGLESDGIYKRQRTDSTQPARESPSSRQTQTPQQPNLTDDEKDKLLAWLDKKGEADASTLFSIRYPKPSGKGKKQNQKETLRLDAQEYGEVAYTVGNKFRWDQLTKYRRCTGE